MKNPRSSPARRARLADSPPGDGGLRHLCLAVALALGLAGSALAQPVIIPIITSTVASLPAGASTGAVRIVTDGNAADDCTTGGGSTRVWCVKTGAGWVAFGDGGGSGGTASAGDSATGFFPAGTLEHERGGLEADVSAFAGLVRIASGSTSAVSTLAALNTALGSSIADGPHTPDTDTTCLDAGVTCLFAASASEGGAATTATALAANGTNCSAGQFPLGVDASGNVEDCTAAGGGSGDVVGPASSTDNAVAIWDGTTGELLQDSTLLWDGADLTLPTATQIQVPYGTTTDPAVEFPGGSGIFGEASNGRVIVTNNGGSAYFQFQIGSGATRTFGGNVTGSPQMMNMAPSATAPNIVLRNNDTTTGLGSNAVGDLRLVATGASSLGVTPTETTLYVEQVNMPSTQTCADDGAGTAASLTVAVSGVSNVRIVSADADGCNLTLSETGASDGQLLELELTSSAGGVVTLADTPGTQNLSAAWTPGAGDSLTLRYNATAAEWRERARSDI